MRNKILELRFSGDHGIASIVLTRKLSPLPEGTGKLFPLTVVYHSQKIISIRPESAPSYYHCRNREHAIKVADALVNGILKG